MSKVQVDKVVNLSDDGAPQLTYGAELPVGYGLTGAGGLNISGVVTAASAVFSGNVTIGGTLTYEDVTNIDVVGVSTFAGRMNVNSTINANEGIKVVGISTLAAVTGTTGTFSGTVTAGFGVFTQSTGQSLVRIGSGNAGGATLVLDGDSDGDASGADYSWIKHNTDGDLEYVVDNPAAAGNHIFKTGGTTERLRIDSSGNIQIKTGISTFSGSGTLRINSGSTSGLLTLDGGSSNHGGEIGLYGGSNGGRILFRTGQGSGQQTEKMRLDENGRLLLGTTTEGEASADNLTIADSGSAGLTLRSGTSNTGHIFFSDATSGSAEYDGYMLFNHSSQYMALGTATAERLRIDASGRILIGATTSRSVWGNHNQFQVEGLGGGANGVSITRNTADAWYPYLAFGKSRGTSDGSSTIVQSGDSTGVISFNGADGTDMNNQTAQIESAVDGTPGSNDMPGRLMFYTTADGDSQGTERVRIDSSGRVLLGTTTEGHASADDLTIAGSADVGITVRSGDDDNGSLFFSDATSGAGEYAGYVQYNHNSNSLLLATSGTNALTIDSSQNATFAGTLSDADGDVRKVKIANKTSSYTLLADDTGRVIYISTGGVTNNNSVMSGNEIITIINNSGSDQTITQGSGMTMYNTADASSGNRTLAGRGMATIWFASASVSYISGAGLS